MIKFSAFFSTAVLQCSVAMAAVQIPVTSAYCAGSGLVVTQQSAKSPVFKCLPTGMHGYGVRLDCTTHFGRYQTTALFTFDADGDILYFDDGRRTTELQRCAG